VSAETSPLVRVTLSAQTAEHRARRRLPRVPTVLRRAVVPVLLLLLWEAGSSWGWWSSTVLPSPLTVVDRFFDLVDSGALGHNLLVSLRRVAIGATLGVTLGLALGTISGLSRIGEETIDATLQMLRTLPFLVMLPLFVLWFGIDETPKVLIIMLGTTFPMYLNTYSGVRSVDPRLVEMGRTFGLGRARLVFGVILPAAVPSILTGLRFSLTVGWLSLVVAEQINAREGIGYLIATAQQLFQTDVLLVCVVLYAVLGLATDLIVRVLEWRLLRWRGTAATW
jgi:sulfonate transport system permease protein